MNYVKKMCILRQIRQGFSGDGKALSGLIKIEQYGKNIAVEVSVINFAPLSSGDYYCLLSDGKGKTEMLTLRGKSLFNLLSDLDVSSGFCGIICYVKNEVVPIAYGINGNKTYDWRTILNAALPPVFPTANKRVFRNEIAGSDHSFIQNEPTVYETKLSYQEISSTARKREPSQQSANDEPPKKQPPEPVPQNAPEIAPPDNAPLPPREDLPPEPSVNEPNHEPYNDDSLANENYYEVKNDERKQSKETQRNAQIEGAASLESEKTRLGETENDDSTRVRDAFKSDPDGYYLAVKEEVDTLFRNYPRDKTLSGAFCCSEWVRVKGDARDPKYLVGVLRLDGKVRYICYALAAEDKANPPEEIKNVCTFVPSSVYDDERGFFVLFQSAATGECIRPERT